MASYSKKTWVDRDAENLAGRILVDDTTGTRTAVTVELNEGEVYTAGDKLNAANFNDLENRVDTAFGNVPSTSDMNTALALKANSADLATVATSGSYNDLSNKPTVDTAMSDSSTNAVQNRVIKAYVDANSGTEVTVTPIITEGESIATITVDGVVTTIKATDYSNALILDVTSVGV